MTKHKQSEYIIDIIIGAIIVVLIVGLLLLINYKYGYNKEDEYYQKLREEVMKKDNPEEKIIDFDELNKNIGEGSVCAWIQIPGTRIDYPLMWHRDNTYYLNHNASGEESRSGAIFLDAACDPTMRSVKSVIYGHSMKDGSMFHTLHKYKDKTFQEEHPLLYIYKDDGSRLTYEFLCEGTVEADDMDVYRIGTSMDALRMINKIMENGTGNVEYNGNHVVLLSTCIKGNKRQVVLFQQKYE